MQRKTELMGQVDYPTAKRQRVMRPDFAQEWINPRLGGVAATTNVPASAIPPQTTARPSSGKFGLPHWLVEDHLHRHASGPSHKHPHVAHKHAPHSPASPRLLNRRQEVHNSTSSYNDTDSSSSATVSLPFRNVLEGRTSNSTPRSLLIHS